MLTTLDLRFIVDFFQIENEYNSVQKAYKEHGTRYVHWAGNMAVGLDIGIPWIMCKQLDAPGPVVGSRNSIGPLSGGLTYSHS